MWHRNARCLSCGYVLLLRYVWAYRPDPFMPYPMFLQMFWKRVDLSRCCNKTVGELRSVIRLDTFNCAGKCFYEVFYKLSGKIVAVFLKRFNKTPSEILVDGGKLEELFSNNINVFQAGRGNKFIIYMDTMSGIIHLFIRLGDCVCAYRG